MKRFLLLPVLALTLAACGGHHGWSSSYVADQVKQQTNLALTGTGVRVTSSYCVDGSASSSFECYVTASDGSSITVAVTCDSTACIYRPESA